MRLLLDTQVWLWMLAEPGRLSRRVRAMVVNRDTELVLSAASAWEIAIKHAIGKLVLPEPPNRCIPRFMRASQVTPLPVHHRHALHVASLPHHHRDPFDRLLVAQAVLEELPILTADRIFQLYQVEVVLAR